MIVRFSSSNMPSKIKCHLINKIFFLKEKFVGAELVIIPYVNVSYIRYKHFLTNICVIGALKIEKSSVNV